MDLTEQLRINSNFRKNIIEMDLIEIKKLTGLSFDDIRTLKIQSMLVEGGGIIKKTN